MSLTATATGVRVLSMARRGKPVGVIAATLRMPKAAVLAILRADQQTRRKSWGARPGRAA